MLTEGLFIPFLDNGNKYYVIVFEGIDEPGEAGLYLAMPYVIGAALVPPFGLLIEKLSNKRSYFIIINCFFFVLTYFSMLLLETSVSLRGQEWFRWLPVAFMGISVALFCTAIVPTLPTIVLPSLLGTAFGLMEMLQNLALGAFPLLGGILR